MRTGEVAAALAPWPVRVASVTPVGGGWNSATWLVRGQADQYIAKLADATDAQVLECSLRVAEFAALHGLACGPPVRTRQGGLTVAVPRGVLALLRYVPGTPPDLGDPDQVRRAGRLLARAHLVLQDYPADGGHYRWPWEWVPRCLDTIPMAPNVSQAARGVWREVLQTVSAHQLTVSVVHADPGPAAFLLSQTSQAKDAMIDWATTLRGPLLYDLACFAVTSSQAGPLVARWFTDGYLEVNPDFGWQLRYLECLIRARWLANAIYFADRIARGIQRGSDSPAANQDGLAAALRGMAGTCGP